MGNFKAMLAEDRKFQDATAATKQAGAMALDAQGNTSREAMNAATNATQVQTTGMTNKNNLDVNKQTIQGQSALSKQNYGQTLGVNAQAGSMALDKSAITSNPNQKLQTSYDPNTYAKYKKGGFVHGKQRLGEGDNRLSAIQTGEYVLPRATTKRLGKENLDKVVQQTTGIKPRGAKRGDGFQNSGVVLPDNAPTNAAAASVESANARVAPTPEQKAAADKFNQENPKPKKPSTPKPKAPSGPAPTQPATPSATGTASATETAAESASKTSSAAKKATDTAKGVGSSIKQLGGKIGSFIDNPIESVKELKGVDVKDKIKNSGETIKNAGKSVNTFLRGAATDQAVADAMAKGREAGSMVEKAKQLGRPISDVTTKIKPYISGASKFMSRANKVGSVLMIGNGAKNVITGGTPEKDAKGDDVGRGGRAEGVADMLHGAVNIVNPLAGLGVSAARWGINKAFDYARGRIDDKEKEVDRVNAEKMVAINAKKAANAANKKDADEKKANDPFNKGELEVQQMTDKFKKDTGYSDEELKDKEMANSKDTVSSRNYFAGRTLQKEARREEEKSKSDIETAKINRQLGKLQVDNFMSKEDQIKSANTTHRYNSQDRLMTNPNLTPEQIKQRLDISNMDRDTEEYGIVKPAKKAVKHVFKKNEPAEEAEYGVVPKKQKSEFKIVKEK